MEDWGIYEDTGLPTKLKRLAKELQRLLIGHRIFAQLETIFSNRYFMASSQLNLLNTILLEDEEN